MIETGSGSIDMKLKVTYINVIYHRHDSLMYIEDTIERERRGYPTCRTKE